MVGKLHQHITQPKIRWLKPISLICPSERRQVVAPALSLFCPLDMPKSNTKCHESASLTILCQCSHTDQQVAIVKQT